MKDIQSLCAKFQNNKV